MRVGDRGVGGCVCVVAADRRVSAENDPYVPYTRVNHAKFLVSEGQGFITTSNWEGDYFLTTAGASFVFTSAPVRGPVGRNDRSVA